MLIKQIDEALEKCESHLASRENVEIEVQTLLTHSLLIFIYAKFEQKIKELIEARFLSVSDNSLKNFVVDGTSRLLRSPAIDQMAELLGLFDSSYKETFKQTLNQNQQTREMYNSLLTNRNQCAHGGNSTATFGDVKQYYKQAHVVLDYFRNALFQDFDVTQPDNSRQATDN